MCILKDSSYPKQGFMCGVWIVLNEEGWFTIRPSQTAAFPTFAA